MFIPTVNATVNQVGCSDTQYEVKKFRQNSFVEVSNFIIQKIHKIKVAELKKLVRKGERL